jgi:hypothetical protein
MTILEWLSYEQLFAFLKMYGFVAQPIPSGGTLWKHESGAVFPLPELDQSEPVRSYHYGTVRALFSDYAILSRDAFEMALLQAAHRLPAPV